MSKKRTLSLREAGRKGGSSGTGLSKRRCVDYVELGRLAAVKRWGAPDSDDKKNRLLKRFEAKINKTDSCWIWQGGRLRDGYGAFTLEGKTISAHRMSYQIFKGPIQGGLWVLHNCDNPACVNPDHLRLGARIDNSKDMVSRGRSLIGEKANRSKLSYADVSKIKRLLSDGVKHRQIAGIYNVSHSVITDINTGKSWKHVP